MKKVILLLAISMLLISACAQQNAQKPEDSIGGGTTIPEGNVISGGEVKEFKMTAKQFQFDPATIEVNKGDKVRLIVTSMDVPHGIAIKEYGINERLEVGKPVTIEFTADKEGSFTAFCSVACGAGHSSMKGKLIVK